jgi:hypothetical protein
MKYIVTWCPVGEGFETLTLLNGDETLTVEEIMKRACAAEDVSPECEYVICSIVRADNVEVIC